MQNISSIFIKTLPAMLILTVSLKAAVVSVSPQPHQMVSNRDLTINILFDQAVSPSAIVAGKHVLVAGNLAGVLKGELTFSQGNRLLQFAVTSPLSAGEVISVNLSNVIPAANGGMRFWEFRTKTAKVENFSLQNTKTIEVYHLAGETEGAMMTYGSFAGDLNQDGWHDITVINERKSDARVYMNDGSGGLIEPPAIYPVGELAGQGTPSTNEGGDFNLDGHLDLAVGQISGSAVSVFMGDGTGALNRTGIYSVGGPAPTSRSTRGLCALDLNGDNYYDIVASNRVGDNISILINNGDGTFATSVELEGGVENETSCASGDFNGDGIEDVVIGGFGSSGTQGTEGGGVAIHLSDGEGNLTLVESSVRSLDTPWMIVTGDFNRDGHLDIVSDNNRTREFSYLQGDGTGNLSAPESYSVAGSTGGFLGPLAIDAGDIDGDGFLDVITSNFGTGNYTLYMGLGDGTFEFHSHLDAEIAGSDALLHDRDGDGDLDFTGVDEKADIILLYENQGDIVEVIKPGTETNSRFKTMYFDAGTHSLVYELAGDQNLEIEISGLKGVTHQTARLNAGAGLHRLVLSNKDISSSILFYKVKGEGYSLSQKLVMLN